MSDGLIPPHAGPGVTQRIPPANGPRAGVAMRQGGEQVVASRRLVAPFARALDLLSAFTHHDRWLSHGELAVRTALPASTVTRMTRALVELGFLHFEAQTRRYRLSASVLALGYAAIANAQVQHHARAGMSAFAKEIRVHVHLSSRDRLDVIVIESCAGAQLTSPLDLHAGSRIGIATSPMGWALLAALPELERYYLMENIERQMPRHWPKLRRGVAEAIEQVHEYGYCSSIGDWDGEIGTVAAPILIEGQAPLVVSCIGSSMQMTRARVARELGPRLLALAASIQQAGDRL